jgi:hypothetical protein
VPNHTRFARIITAAIAAATAVVCVARLCGATARDGGGGSRAAERPGRARAVGSGGPFSHLGRTAGLHGAGAGRPGEHRAVNGLWIAL